MLADIGLVHVLAAAVLGYGLYAAVVATVTGFKAHRLARGSGPDAAYLALCARRGWTYASKDQNLVTRFQLLPTGDSALVPQAVNVVTGTFAGLPFLSYEHRAWSRDHLFEGVSRYRPEFLHVVGFDLEHLHPWLHLRPGRRRRPENDFERAYVMETTRQAFATALLHEEMRAHLLRHPARYQFDGTWVVMAVDGPAPADELEPRLADLFDFLDLVPDHLLNRY